MKTALSYFVLLTSLLLCIGAVQAQKQDPAKVLPGMPTAFDADASGDFYLGFAGGQLIKHSRSGQQLEIFSLPNNSAINAIDAQNRLKPFLFQFDIQQITVLDRFSTVPKTYSLSDFGVNLATMACPAPDGDFWILENNPQRLIKYNPLRKAVMLEIQPSLGDSITRMKAYQNVLLIADPGALHLFDVFGTGIRSMDIPHIVNIQMVKNEAIIYTTDSVYTVDPFKGEKVSSIPLPASNVFLKNPSYWISTKNQRLRLFEIKE